MNCENCGRDKILAEGPNKKQLCNDCWHEAREREPPWVVKRYTTLEHDEKYGHMLFGPAMTYLESEAKERAEKLNSEKWRKEERWVAEPSPNGQWFGDRVAHPGFMVERRAAIRAANKAYSE